MKGRANRFAGTVEPPGFIRVPPDVMAAFAPHKRVPVRVSIGDFTYRSTVATYGGEFMIPVRAEVRNAARVTLGERVTVTLERDDAPRTVELPSDLAAAIRKARLEPAFRSLAFTHQKEYVQWVEQAKRTPTREARIAKTIDAIRLRPPRPSRSRG